MINYRVDDLVLLALQVTDGGRRRRPESHENGSKFTWIMDPDGNKVEFWSPGTRTKGVTTPPGILRV